MSKLVMERSGIIVTSYCNLNCALCSAYVPYYKQSHVPIDKITVYLKKFFEIVSYVKRFTISGGEPLIYPELERVINECYKYETQIGDLQLITNGTIVPSKNVLFELEKFGCKANILVDNYGGTLSRKIDVINDVLGNTNVRYVIRENNDKDSHCSGWVDYGDLTQKKCEITEEIKQVYANCAQSQKLKFCFSIWIDGSMHPCSQSRRCMELGSIPYNYREYVDLLDESLTIEEQKNKIRDIYSSELLTACSFCNGMNDSSERFVPGVQLTSEEKNCIKQGANQYSEVKRMLKNFENYGRNMI